MTKLLLINELSFNKELGTYTYLARCENNQLVIIKKIEATDEQCPQVEREIECLHANHLLVDYSYEEPKEKKLRGKNPFNKKPITRLYFIVMDMIPGINLQDFVSAGSLTAEQWFAIFYHMAKGLQQFHDNGYVHRDVKPDNFMINEKGIHPVDFGNSIKKEYAEQYIVLGKPGFLAAETSTLKNGTKPKNDQKSDLASLGYSFLYLLDCFRLTLYYRDELDFADEVPSTLLKHGFNNEQIQQLIILFQDITQENPDKRPDLHSICEQFKNLSGGKISLDWIEERIKNQLKNDHYEPVNKVMKITPMSISELVNHGYEMTKLKSEDEKIQTGPPSSMTQHGGEKALENIINSCHVAKNSETGKASNPSTLGIFSKPSVLTTVNSDKNPSSQEKPSFYCDLSSYSF
ncbi:protein kinase family protein [Legionella israelensis]|uniref:Serine/threonine-protein kinase n=2 Tax=Legionella israelensis TaxID=454 RepID=A0A0W0VKZ7_9GAMM|nr:protein kinase family protein [Legionella israelensis]KTD20778.1 serine/threonine-protein kinase [Legionella israelensis]SCY06327.1 Serine/threonine protein kinase [Legionella israelensis DSM 19235]STX57984.1 serine/threonine-protein kinase [Legionella israelensis]